MGKGAVSVLSPISHDAEASHEGADTHSQLGLHRLCTGKPVAGREAAKRGFQVTKAALGKAAGLYP